ncbi:hypothetical protein ACRRTK_017526 [Alexandromys fortis]
MGRGEGPVQRRHRRQLCERVQYVRRARGRRARDARQHREAQAKREARSPVSPPGGCAHPAVLGSLERPFSIRHPGRSDGLQSQTEFHCTPVVFHFRKEDSDDGYSQVIEKVIELAGFSWMYGSGGHCAPDAKGVIHVHEIKPN